MKSRCYVKSHPNYKYYGAKGVTISERWLDFWNFVHDVDNHLKNGHLLYDKRYQLDKDIKGGNIYSLDNCMVVTREENDKFKYEKQQKKIIVLKDNNEETRFNSIAECSRVLHIPRGTINKYLNTGKVHSSGFVFKNLY